MTILQTLKNHYQDALLSHERLGCLPDIQKEEWGKMSAVEAQKLLNWTLSQKWVCQQEIMYDWICGLSSPALKILYTLLDHGFGMQYSVPICAESKVLLANACAVGIRCNKLSEEFNSYITQGVTEGDPSLLAMDFLQWTEDFANLDIAFERIVGVDESDLHCPSTQAVGYNLVEALEGDEKHERQWCQWMKNQFDKPWFPSVILAASPCIWNWENGTYSSCTPNQIQQRHEKTQKLFKNISPKTIQCIIEEAEKEGEEAKYLDSLMPLFPETVQKHHMHNPFFDNQPYTHQLRFKQHLKDSVECFGASTVPRKM